MAGSAQSKAGKIAASTSTADVEPPPAKASSTKAGAAKATLVKAATVKAAPAKSNEALTAATAKGAAPKPAAAKPQASKGAPAKVAAKPATQAAGKAPPVKAAAAAKPRVAVAPAAGMAPAAKAPAPVAKPAPAKAAPPKEAMPPPPEPAKAPPPPMPPARPMMGGRPSHYGGRPGMPGLRPDAMPPPPRPKGPPVEFKAGDHVVYPTHGVGQVQGVEDMPVAGLSLKVIIVTFEENRMTLRVPVNKAASSGLRKLATNELINEALDVLKGRARIKRTMWSRRAQEYEQKINSGDPLSIAEVVRDLHRNSGQPDQSFSERQIYEQALDRLSSELAAIDRTDKATAQEKLLGVLKSA